MNEKVVKILVSAVLVGQFFVPMDALTRGTIILLCVIVWMTGDNDES